MEPYCGGMGKRIAAGLAVLIWTGTATSALADGATRDLPDEYMPGVLLTVSIEIVAPPDSDVVGIEDVPPSGWTNVSNISDGGIYDSDNEKVKWPPFFDNFSRTVSYDITPPGWAEGEQCFTGYVSIDGDEQPTAGDDCISLPITIPVLSDLGVIVMAFMLLAAGAVVHRKTTQGKQHCQQ